MVAEPIALAIREYLRAANSVGIHARRAVLFGSQARGNASEWSDIDLVVIAPELDGPDRGELSRKLWRLRAYTDSRIEPIACGEKEWQNNQDRLILETARREGVVIEM